MKRSANTHPPVLHKTTAIKENQGSNEEKWAAGDPVSDTAEWQRQTNFSCSMRQWDLHYFSMLQLNRCLETILNPVWSVKVFCKSKWISLSITVKSSLFLPRDSLSSWFLWAPLQSVMSTVCAQHGAMSPRHGSLWVPGWLLRLALQPRQVVYISLCFSAISLYSLFTNRLLRF